MAVDITLEPLQDVRPISPAPADEESPPGSSDEDESNSEEEGVGSGVKPKFTPRATLDSMTASQMTRPCYP